MLVTLGTKRVKKIQSIQSGIRLILLPFFTHFFFIDSFLFHPILPMVPVHLC